MHRFLLSTLLLLALTSVSACTHLQYFADSDHELITATSLEQVQPTAVRLDVKFLRGDQEIPEAEAVLKRNVVYALNATSVLRASDDPATPSTLHVEVVDYANSGEQPNGDYLFSGLTHGAVATSRITDRYEFKLRYTLPNGHQRFGQDKHAIWTKIGDETAPSLRGPYRSPKRAFQAVVTDVVLTFLKNVNQSDGSADSVMFVPESAP